MFNFQVTIKYKRGYSLVEVILYIALTSIIIGAISSLVGVTESVRARTLAIAEVEQVGNQIVLIINQNVHSTTKVNSPAQGNSASSISLESPNASLNPILISLINTNLNMIEGSNQPIFLNPSSVNITSLTFQNVSRLGTKDSIKYNFTISYNNTSGRNEYNYSRTFYSTANIR